MLDPSFVHLRLHSEYSIVDGIVRIDDAVAHARADRMPALALTDLNNLFGAVKFYKAARSQGVKPIIGCDVWVANEDNRDQPHRLTLLSRSRQGYRNLCELLSRAYRENFDRGRAQIRGAWLAQSGSGLIALSGAAHGDVGKALLQDNARQATRLAQSWMQAFANAYYIEL
jgi:DNA polymerase III subunit alpha